MINVVIAKLKLNEEKADKFKSVLKELGYLKTSIRSLASNRKNILRNVHQCRDGKL